MPGGLGDFQERHTMQVALASTASSPAQDTNGSLLNGQAAGVVEGQGGYEGLAAPVPSGEGVLPGAAAAVCIPPASHVGAPTESDEEYFEFQEEEEEVLISCFVAPIFLSPSDSCFDSLG